MKIVFKLIVAFMQLSLANFAALAKRIYDSLITGPGVAMFPDPWPDPYPKRTDLTSAYTAFVAAQTAAADGGKIGRDNLKARRVELTAIFTDLSPLFESIAKAANNEAMLDATGYNRRQPSLRPSSLNGTLPAPQFKVKRGTLSGTARGDAKMMDGARSFEGQVATGDPAVEGNFKTVVFSTRATHIDFPDLTLGQLYHFRLRAYGSKGHGEWSEVVNLIAT